MKKLTGIFLIVVVAIAAAMGIGIYNTPTNRINRHLDLGQKYLEEQNYEQALIEFNKAIAIDEKCMKAYDGQIKAYIALGQADELMALYEDVLTIIESLEQNEVENNLDIIVSIYLVADDVYSGDTEKIGEVLEKGAEKTGSPQLEAELEANHEQQKQEALKRV